MLCGLCVKRPLGKPRDARENLVGGFGPDERLEIRMVGVDECLDGGLQLRHAAVRPAADLFVRQLANQRSTRLSHELYVGVKWTWNRGRLANPLRMSGVLRVP